MSKTNTPETITSEILELCNEICPGNAPFYVPCKIEPDAIVAECFPNVEKKISCDGGTQILGWAIWEWPNQLIEGEFHSVWQSPTAEYLDVTPREIITNQILFLPDYQAVYDGKAKDNVRKSISSNRLVIDFIKASKKKFKLLNAGKLADYYGPLYMTPEMERIFNKIEMIISLIHDGLDENAFCLCGKNGKKYKNCCGREFG